MFVLHVGIRMKPGQGPAAEKMFAGPFHAAISAQPGFHSVALLRPDDGGEHVLSIAFENQALQKQWVATALHDQVWAQMEQHFEAYGLRTFTAVKETPA